VEIGVLERDAHQLLVSLMKMQLQQKQTVNAERHSCFCSQALLGELLLSLVLLLLVVLVLLVLVQEQKQKPKQHTSTSKRK
jgi:uncharacterized membrane protein